MIQYIIVLDHFLTMKPMIIDISQLKDFNASIFHEIIRYKDNVVLIGSNHRFE